MSADTERLTAAQVAERVAGLPGWAGDAEQIEATYALGTFLTAIDLVDLVAQDAEQANHHPDIDIRWRRVTFRLTTHDAGGVTGKDLAMAERIQAHAHVLGWQPA